MDIYEELAANANEAGKIAMLTDKSNDTRRLFADLATMWHAAARHAHQVEVMERLEQRYERKFERLAERVAVLEEAFGIGRPMPDPFVEEDD